MIEHYNTADAYIIGIGHLADRIKGGPPIAAAWPRELRALTLDERKELQDGPRRVRSRWGGWPDGAKDHRGGQGVPGKRAGGVPDGYPSLEVLALLR